MGFQFLLLQGHCRFCRPLLCRLLLLLTQFQHLQVTAVQSLSALPQQLPLSLLAQQVYRELEAGQQLQAQDTLSQQH